jgi:hypothetical protein
MSPTRARYVTACQQLLALGVVVMALVPATRVVSLDVVGVRPGQGVALPTIAVSPKVGMSDYARAKQHASDRRAGHRFERSLRVAERRHPAGGRQQGSADQP